MTERITPRQFHEAAGVEDWRVLSEGACTHHAHVLLAVVSVGSGVRAGRLRLARRG